MTTIRRLESQIELSPGAPRYRRAWLPSAPERLMVLVHGYAEHSGRYDEMAMHFAERGFAVHAYDQAGHGRSPGPRGHVDRYERLLDELAGFVDRVRADHPGLETTLVGHSMGGLVSAATVAFRSPSIDRLVLSGAALDLGGATSRRQRLTMALLSPLGSWMNMALGLDARGLSRDPEVVRRYEEDPLVEDRMSARFASGMVKTVLATGEAADRIDRPALILHGAADPICPVSGSEGFYARLTPEIAEQSRLHVYPELRHEIFNEPERQEVWQDVLDWLAE